jgi:16S rRNA (cytidine1402-2'-O)-methyltransferase
VLFESPYRLLRLMDEIEAALGARTLFVGRELTKLFEEGLSGRPADIRAAFAQRAVKGELVVVIAPADRKAQPGPDESSKDWKKAREKFQGLEKRAVA